MEYKQKEFNIPETFLSKKQIDLHLGLYAGYINKTNSLHSQINKLEMDGAEDNILVELRRRLSFELAGIYNHELYFSLIDGSAVELSDCELKIAINNSFESFEKFISILKQVSTNARGIGWVIVNYDAERKSLNILWVEDHELGNISLPAILAIDMWEHAYLIDYNPKDKGEYVEKYLAHINWQKCSDRFDTLAG